MKIIQSVIEHIKAFFLKYTNNSSHTLSADIKEFFATYILSVGYYILHILPQRDELKKTKELKNTKRGKNCFVFANGPSMNLLDVEKIEGYQKAGFDVICVNSYILSDMAKTVVPNYYVLSDPVSFGVLTNYSTKEKIIIDEKILKKIGETVPKKLDEMNIPVFIPAQYSNYNLFKNYYIFNDFENRFNGNIDPTKNRGYISNTAYKALALAIYLGYDTIYLCGLDLDYFKTIVVDKNNIIQNVNVHYYDNSNRNLCIYDVPRINHSLWTYFLMFKHLELFTNPNTINLNKNGLVDVFSKKHDLDIYKL